MTKVNWGQAVLDLQKQVETTDGITRFIQTKMRDHWKATNSDPYDDETKQLFQRFAVLTLLYQGQNRIGIPDGLEYHWDLDVSAEEYLTDFQAAKEKQLRPIETERYA